MDQTLPSIMTLSRWLYRFTLLIAAFCLVGALWLCLDPTALRDVIAGNYRDRPLTGPKHIGLVLLGGVMLAATLAALWSIARLFADFARGEILTARTAEGVRRIGLRLVTVAALSLLMPTALSLLMTYDAGPGQRELSITLSSGMMMSALMGGLMVVIGWVLRTASDIAQDNAAII